MLLSEIAWDSFFNRIWLQVTHTTHVYFTSSFLSSPSSPLCTDAHVHYKVRASQLCTDAHVHYKVRASPLCTDAHVHYKVRATPLCTDAHVHYKVRATIENAINKELLVDNNNNKLPMSSFCNNSHVLLMTHQVNRENTFRQKTRHLSCKWRATRADESTPLCTQRHWRHRAALLNRTLGPHDTTWYFNLQSTESWHYRYIVKSSYIVYICRT